jgi:hypothetical protein
VQQQRAAEEHARDGEGELIAAPPLLTPNVCAPWPPNASARPPPFGSCRRMTKLNSTTAEPKNAIQSSSLM